MFDYSVGNSRAVLKACENKLAKYDEGTPLYNVDDDDLLAVINMSEELALAGRKAYRAPEYMSVAVHKRDMDKYDEAMNKYGVLGYSPEGHVRVVVPPLINRRNRRFGSSAYTFSDLFWSANQRDEFLRYPGGRHFFVYKRYISKPHSQRCMDNENLDAHNLTNAVCSLLGLSDRALSASFVYSAVESPYDMDELTVIPYSEMTIVPAILEPTEPLVFNREGEKIEVPK